MGLECANTFQMVPNAHHCVPTERDALIFNQRTTLLATGQIGRRFCLGIFDGQKDHASWSGNVWWGILLGQLTLRDTFVEFDMDNYQVNMAATNCAALRKKYTKALPSGKAKTFPSLSQRLCYEVTLAAVGNAGLSVWLLAWGMRLAIRLARTRHRRMGWRRLEDELDTQIEMGDVPHSRAT